MFLSKYGVARHIYIPIVKRGVVDFSVSADWTPAAGDVKISKDGGAFANVTNLPTAIASANTGAVWDFALTATEMQAAQVVVVISDAATKAVEDQSFIIETHGNASAQFQVDLADSVRAGLTALPNATVSAVGGLLTAPTTANVGLADLSRILGTALTETAGQIAGGFKKLFDVTTPVFDLLSVKQTGDAYARVGAPAGASLAADVAAVKTDTAAVKVQTDKLTFTVANQIDANVLDWKSATAPAMTGDAFARLGAPAGASVSADIAAVKADTANIYAAVDTEIGTLITSIGSGLNTAVLAVKAKTDNLPAAPAAVSDIPTANANADALLDRAAGVETGLTFRQAMRGFASVLLSKLSGAGTATEVFRDFGDTKARITATVDSSGNRTAITRDLT